MKLESRINCLLSVVEVVTEHSRSMLISKNHMKLNCKLELNILDFFKSGIFDFIKLGQSKDWILANFPDPDDFGMGKDLKSAAIWRYGNIEFYFSNEILVMIFSDYINQLHEFCNGLFEYIS